MTNQRLTEIKAKAADAILKEWGSEEQIEAENAVFDLSAEMMNIDWDEFSDNFIKATTEDMMRHVVAHCEIWLADFMNTLPVGIVPACGGAEQPFTVNGTRWLYVWDNHDLRHGYLNLDTDIVNWDREFHPSLEVM